MKITRNMIDLQLRLRGEMIRAINPLGSYGMQGIMGLLSKLALGALPLKSLNCTKTAIFRKNGTYFRTCIFKSKNAGESIPANKNAKLNIADEKCRLQNGQI